MREDGITDKQVDPFVEIARRGRVRARRRGGGLAAARLAARRPPGPGAALRPRLPRPRLDGAPLRRGEGELAHARRRRPADRNARVQGLRGPAGARLTSLAPAFAEPLLRGRFGRPYFYLEQCETTQRMLDAAQPEGAVARLRGADRRAAAGWAGAGRRRPAPRSSSRSLLRPPPERRAAELTLVAGVATAVVVERATGLAAQIKWPNDVMLDRRKVAGGLAELKDGAVVLGIGLNVNQTPEQLPAETKVAAGLAALGDGPRVRARADPRRPAARARAPLRRLARRRARRALRRPRRARLPARPPRHASTASRARRR